VALSALALATERVRIGPYVMNAHARSPWIAGMTAVDLDELSGGRLVMALGSGNRVTNEQYQGIPVVRPLAKMRDYIAVVRAVTQAGAGGVVEYGGQMHSSSGWVSQVEPVRSRIDLHLAATSPKMEELAAEVADGVALGSLVSVDFVSAVAERCRAKAGSQFAVRASSFVSVDDDADLARARARMAVVNLYAGKPHPHYDALLRRQGFDEVADLLIKHVAAGDLAAASSSVSDEVVDSLTVAGTPDECRARLAEYAPVLDELILMNVGAMRFSGPGRSAVSERDDLLESFEPMLELPR
jgi:alkanesulfonate monooxygenase SsuD/methylene tetrahydromethanopterin reductase-like flavin-dependent oxidoreductase (luciferase family)